MNLKKIYKDIEGEDCNILELVILDQVWAANRIQEGEKAIAKLAKIKETWDDLIGGTSEPDGFDVVVSRIDYESMIKFMDSI